MIDHAFFDEVQAEEHRGLGNAGPIRRGIAADGQDTPSRVEIDRRVSGPMRRDDEGDGQSRCAMRGQSLSDVDIRQEIGVAYQNCPIAAKRRRGVANAAAGAENLRLFLVQREARQAEWPTDPPRDRA